MDAETLKRWIYSDEDESIRSQVVGQLRSHGLDYPFFLMTYFSKGGGQEGAFQDQFVLKQGSLIHVLSASKDPLLSTGEEVYDCESYEQLIAKVRDSILVIRRRQLQDLFQSYPDKITHEHRVEALELCQRCFRQTGDPFDKALHHLLNVYQARYHIRLNAYRVNLSYAWMMLWRLTWPFKDPRFDNRSAEVLARISSSTDYVAMASEFFQNMKVFREIYLSLSSQHSEQESWPELVQEARGWIEKHFREDVSLIHVSLALHVSSPYLSKLYKKYTGKTVVRDLQDRRLEWARAVLKEKKVNITRLAYDAGFNSPEHFQRCYKNKFGQSPGKDRVV